MRILRYFQKLVKIYPLLHLNITLKFHQSQVEYHFFKFYAE